MIRKLPLHETETESKKVILEHEPNSHKRKKDEQTNAGIIEDKLTQGRTEKTFRGNSPYARPSIRSFCWSVRSFVRSFVWSVGRSVARLFVCSVHPSVLSSVRSFVRSSFLRSSFCPCVCSFARSLVRILHMFSFPLGSLTISFSYILYRLYYFPPRCVPRMVITPSRVQTPSLTSLWRAMEQSP